MSRTTSARSSSVTSALLARNVVIDKSPTSKGKIVGRRIDTPDNRVPSTRRRLSGGKIMGNRANLVLVDGDSWQLRYSHWAGCRMLDALIAGPEMAKRYILAQKVASFWTDELWADG
jgi:hypothetical protein